MSLDKVTDRVKQVGEQLAQRLAVDAEGSIQTTAELFAETLPEGVTLESVIAGQNATQDFADGLGLAVKILGLPALKANPELAAITVAGAAAGNDKIAVQLLRSRDGRNPQTGEVTTKHGVLSLSYVTGIGAKRGNLKRIQEATSAEAAAIFGK